MLVYYAALPCQGKMHSAILCFDNLHTISTMLPFVGGCGQEEFMSWVDLKFSLLKLRWISMRSSELRNGARPTDEHILLLRTNMFETDTTAAVIISQHHQYPKQANVLGRSVTWLDNAFLAPNEMTNKT
jgi:hypothetical protein